MGIIAELAIHAAENKGFLVKSQIDILLEICYFLFNPEREVL
jgi:hypothetical protein